MKLAIANHRAFDAIVDEMREITPKLILRTPETAEYTQSEDRPKPRLT